MPTYTGEKNLTSSTLNPQCIYTIVVCALASPAGSHASKDLIWSPSHAPKGDNVCLSGLSHPIMPAPLWSPRWHELGDVFRTECTGRRFLGSREKPTGDWPDTKCRQHVGVKQPPGLQIFLNSLLKALLHPPSGGLHFNYRASTRGQRRHIQAERAETADTAP